MTSDIIAALIIAALIGFVVALGITRFSAFITARLFLDNLEMILKLSFAERENVMLAQIVENLTGEKIETVKQMRKKHREMMKKGKSDIEREQ